MSTSRLAAGWAALVLGVVAVGCRGDRSPEVRPAAGRVRMITDSVEQQFDLGGLRRPEPAAVPDLVAAGTAGWRARTTDPVTIAADRIEIGSGDDFVSLQREVRWTAGDLDALVVGVDRLAATGRPLTIYWAGPGEAFAEERAVRPDEIAPGTWSAVLVGHPRWAGEVVKIRIDLPDPAEGTTVLRSVEPVVFHYDADAVGAAAASFWKVDLGDDLRSVGLAAPDRPLVWTLEKPAAGPLEFAFGVLGATQGSVRLRADVSSGEGDWTTVFSDGDDGSTSVGGPWRDVRVDLAAHEPVRAVRFALVPADGAARAAGIAAIANPVLGDTDPNEGRVNVLLISLDTLRADRLRPYGYGETTSPNIDARAARSGVVFTRTVAASPRTLPSHTSMMTGLDCVHHGVNHYAPAPQALVTLAEILRDEGWTTAATVGGGLMDPGFGLGQGFDEYYHYAGWAGGFEELETEVDRALDKLTRLSDRPFFMFFHTYEIHDPFHARPPFSDRCYAGPADDPVRNEVFGVLPRPRSEEDGLRLMFDLVSWDRGQSIDTAVAAGRDRIELVRCLYDSAITYADSQVERLLNRLDERGVLDDTLVVITSDHGEALGEKGLFKHAYLYDNNLMVPLFIFLPGGRHGGTVVDRQVATVDIVPTILDAVGLEAPAAVDGESLMPLLRGEEAVHRPEAWSYAAFENRGISLRIDNRVKYTFNNTAPSSAHGDEELFDLADDPEERRNMASVDPDAVSRLRDRLETYYEVGTTGAPLEIVNTGCELITGVVAGAPFDTELKALDLDDGSLRRVTDQQVDLRVRRDRTLRLFVEAGAEIAVEVDALGCGAGGEDATFRRTIDLDAVTDEPLRLGLVDGEWRELDAAAPMPPAGARAGLAVGGHAGPAAGAGDGGPVDDEAVLEQLRSLGYID